MNFIKNIYKTQLFKISSLNGVSVVIRILGGLVTSKAIATYVGAGGMALTGNLRNFLTSVEYFSTLGMQNGVIVYIAENEKEEKKLYTVLGTVFITLCVVCLITSSILIIFSDFFSRWIFVDEEQYRWVIYILGLSLPWYAASLIFMAVLNGLNNYKKVIWINILGNVTGVGLSVVLMWKFHIQGALLGLILIQILLFIYSLIVIWQKFPGMPFLKFSYFDFKILKGLLSYSVITLVTALLAPVIYPAIRNNLIDNFSEDTAGHWEAMNRLSSFYMMFASTMLTVHFLPKLSTALPGKETKQVFRNYYKSMIPLFGVGLTAIYFLRNYIVLLIFKEEFLPMEKLFFWQLLGDLFKVGTLILGYQFFAKKLIKQFIFVEVFSSLILYGSSVFLISKFGVEGAVMGHACTYFFLLLLLLLYFRKDLL